MAVAGLWNRLAAPASQAAERVVCLKQPTPREARTDKGFGYPGGIVLGMDFCAELNRGDAKTSLPEWGQAQFAALQSQLAACDAELKRRELKIQQLTLELN